MQALNIEEIKSIAGDVRADEPMSGHTTFRVGGPADIYVEPTAEELLPLLDYLKKREYPYYVVGNGSNLLVGDGGIRGVVVSIGEKISEISVDEHAVIHGLCDDEPVIYAGAGAMLARVASVAASHGLSGLEFASGIPGSVGGGVAMNAGAYGGEMKDVVLYVTALHDGRQVTYSCEEMDFSYRHSRILDSSDIVTGVCLKLVFGSEDDIRARMADLNGRRAEKQPINLPSAGSTFKRPEGYFAGKLIEDAGLRGYRVGGACVSEKHCGFVVNDRGAKASDIKTLIGDVQKKVFEDAGVRLETEVRMIGEF
mgnify:CR=1 FL=1